LGPLEVGPSWAKVTPPSGHDLISHDDRAASPARPQDLAADQAFVTSAASVCGASVASASQTCPGKGLPHGFRTWHHPKLEHRKTMMQSLFFSQELLSKSIPETKLNKRIHDMFSSSLDFTLGDE